MDETSDLFALEAELDGAGPASGDQSSTSTSRFNVKLEYEGLKCPQNLVMCFTPLEFEEVASTFKENDVDNSGAIDKNELKTMLHNLDIDCSEDMLENLFKMVDTDGNGTLEFSEYCELIAKIKSGDQSLKGFARLVEMLDSSPVSLLERQARERGLDMSYKPIEVSWPLTPCLLPEGFHPSQSCGCVVGGPTSGPRGHVQPHALPRVRGPAAGRLA
jgi:hypothetical protein